MKLALPEDALRWAPLGPYYAMFPLTFAIEVISEFSAKGDAVLDPFVGRGSSVFVSAALERQSTGIEISPVGWIYSRVKLHPAHPQLALLRLAEIVQASAGYHSAADALPEFFHYCYARDVVAFLLAARSELKWKTSRVDATLMAIILVYLHGKWGQALSNQMRQTKAMSPSYSVRWWKNRSVCAPIIDIFSFFRQRIMWRYGKGHRHYPKSRVYLGDSSKRLLRLNGGFKLLFTSPPYYGITNYHYDQWLRLWVLGGPQAPRSTGNCMRGKFENRQVYRKLLEDVFAAAAQLLRPDSIVYVRTDARQYTFETTRDVLRKAFPHKSMTIRPRPHEKKTQTQLFGTVQKNLGEIDIVLT